MDRLCLNAHCSLITATTWPASYFYYCFDDKIFVTVDKKAGIFTKKSGNPTSREVFSKPIPSREVFSRRPCLNAMGCQQSTVKH